MQFLISFLLIVATTGFDVSLIPDSRGVQISSNLLNDAVLPPASQSSVQSPVNNEGLLDSSEIQRLNRISGEWCTRPVDSNKGQKERFDACVKRIKDCVNTFNINRYGDHKVECKNDAVLPSTSRSSVRSLANDEGVLASTEIQKVIRISGEWCVRPIGYTEKQRKRFHACVERIKDCENEFHVNRYGDHKVECKNDAVFSSASRSSVRPLANDGGVLDSSEIQKLNRISGEWCTRPLDATKGQKERFDSCVKRIRDCENTFNINRYGDHKVECKNGTILPLAPQPPVRPLIPLSDH
jgi:hypothetical protein